MLSPAKDAKGGALLDDLGYKLNRDVPDLLLLEDMPMIPRSAELPLEAIGDEVPFWLSASNL
jgi:hypothetical protein